MRQVGLGLLSEAQVNTFLWYYGNTVDVGIYAVTQSAHSAEILIKAAIAEQHPLLIFSQLPKSINVVGDLLDFESLFESGKTLEYSELPERLWAATGYKIKDLAMFNSFGKLRNGIQHFAKPENNLSEIAGEFIYKVIDPILEHFWGLFAVEYCNHKEAENDLIPILVKRGVKFRYPEKLKAVVDEAKKSIVKK